MTFTNEQIEKLLQVAKDVRRKTISEMTLMGESFSEYPSKVPHAVTRAVAEAVAAPLETRIAELESEAKKARVDVIHYKGMTELLPQNNLLLAKRNVELTEHIEAAQTRIAALEAACDAALKAMERAASEDATVFDAIDGREIEQLRAALEQGNHRA